MQAQILIRPDISGGGGREGWRTEGPIVPDAGLVFYFGSRLAIADGRAHAGLCDLFPTAAVIGCSTGGQILGDDVIDDEVVAVALRFDRTTLRVARARCTEPTLSRPAGFELGTALAAVDLAGVFVLSDGLTVNGSELVAGLNATLGSRVPISGGLAGDGVDFAETSVAADAPPESGVIAAVGFYGEAVRFETGSAGGWSVFGPKRTITGSVGNVLRELDGEPALDLYERYLGPEAADLPGSALLFPLRIYDPDVPEHDVVRTVLGIDREARTMTFAGDMPQGWSAQLMRGTHRSLIAGSEQAAAQARPTTEVVGDAVTILVSCIGRRLLMGQRVSDEVEAAHAVLGSTTPCIGFYSYGELSPHAHSRQCELHNQTMTITSIGEVI